MSPTSRCTEEWFFPECWRDHRVQVKKCSHGRKRDGTMSTPTSGEPPLIQTLKSADTKQDLPSEKLRIRTRGDRGSNVHGRSPRHARTNTCPRSKSNNKIDESSSERSSSSSHTLSKVRTGILLKNNGRPLEQQARFWSGRTKGKASHGRFFVKRSTSVRLD